MHPTGVTEKERQQPLIRIQEWMRYSEIPKRVLEVLTIAIAAENQALKPVAKQDTSHKSEYNKGLDKT